MPEPSKKRIVAQLLARHGRTYCDELGIAIARNTPSVLFRWLTASLLFSARIAAPQAMSAARALTRAGWTTADKMAAATWRQRTDVLNRSGYARYDESTSRMLGETASLVADRWKGDLRNLRAEAGRDVQAEHRLLKLCKGIGDVGAAIFLREVQTAWDEVYPFADRRSLKAADRLSLGADARALARRATTCRGSSPP